MKALRRFFRRFQPRVLHVQVIDNKTGAVCLDVDEKSLSMLAALQGHPGIFDHRFSGEVRLLIRVTP